MHSYIIQIDCKPISRENYISEDIAFNSEFVDYSYEISPEEREELLKSLTEIFHAGIFEIKDHDALVYTGGIEEWKKDWIEKIIDDVERLTPETVFQFPNLYNLENHVKNSLETDILFVLQCWTGDCIVRSTEFMEYVNTKMKVGDAIYIGNVLGYHF